MPFPDERADTVTALVHAVPDALAYLAGDWRVERTVRDFAGAAGAPAEGVFTGTTRFTPLDGAEPADAAQTDATQTDAAQADAGLLHHESGTFTWHGVARPAERTLRFLPGALPGTVCVHFADGRFFHDLDLRSGRHTADHPCAADLYRGEFEVYDEARWRTRWRVAGPAKDLLLTTDYTRVL
ncbi:DUF6314 family protein [Streptomyces lasiicapitis]|uniref:DUF6314 domain-containing protein n=1 Tax=Streptomyces lasiicapitis TaxID=1923961 RepID=A0ABQ2MF50_9ACTN|nr:DUF6314 family protein [Streptomyces lasiicapitis]GGO51354.1 hypothetical protein GCM10012286_53870 [Streptomyces lasiicapitis]